MTTKPEIIEGMPFSEYRGIPAANCSMLKAIKRSPKHAHYAMTSEQKSTPQMMLGRIFHCLVLEADDFENQFYVQTDDDPTLRKALIDVVEAIETETLSEKFFVDEGDKPTAPRAGTMAEEILQAIIDGGSVDDYVVEPADINKRTKEGKAEFAAWQDKVSEEGKIIVKQTDIDKAQEYALWHAKVGGRTVISERDFLEAKNYASFLSFIGSREVITPKQHEQATGMAQSVLSHPVAKKLLSGGRSELTVTWTDKETGQLCKIRIDHESDRGYLCDLKGTPNVGLEDFKRSISKFGYHIQDAMYTEGYGIATGKVPKGFLFITCEWEPPHDVVVYMLHSEDKQKGADEFHELLGTYVQCKTNDVWPGVSASVVEIELPSWHK